MVQRPYDALSRQRQTRSCRRRGLRELPTGEGLIAFRTLDEAIAGAQSICSDYERHSAAARAIAARYLILTMSLATCCASSISRKGQ